MTKHKAVQITLEDQSPVTFYAADGVDVWKLTDDYLREMALDEQGRLGYAKYNFSVLYDDGNTYEGRYDLRYGDKDYTGLLARHITTFQEWVGGRCADPWTGVPFYREFIARQRVASGVAEAERFLDEYEIGSDMTPWPRDVPVRVALWEHPVYVKYNGKLRLSRFIRLCQPHREKREANPEARFSSTRYDSDKKCDDCAGGDLIAGPGRLAA